MRHLGTQTIETPRLLLRRFVASDAQAMYIPYDMISEWSVERTTSGTQVAAFLIKGKQYVYKETFRMRGFKSLFKKFLPDKEFVPPKKNKRY